MKFKGDKQAQQILLDGVLLEYTEQLAHSVLNNPFSVDVITEIGLIMAGQIAKWHKLPGGMTDRGFSHALMYSPRGMSKGMTLDFAFTPGITPFWLDTGKRLRYEMIDDINPAVLTGSVANGYILEPPILSNDIIICEEYETIMAGMDFRQIRADLRRLLDKGKYNKRRVKVCGELHKQLDQSPKRRDILLAQLRELDKRGMKFDINSGKIEIQSTTSWICASARFGSAGTQGQPLLELGDLSRYRTIASTPTRSERYRTCREVFKARPVSKKISSIKNPTRRAWSYVNDLQHFETIELDGDIEIVKVRGEIYDKLMDEIGNEYGNYLNDGEDYWDEIINNRFAAEIRRVMVQHALLNQFERDQGYDFDPHPQKFRMDYKRDAEYATRRYLDTYIPGIISIIRDIKKKRDKKVKSRYDMWMVPIVKLFSTPLEEISTKKIRVALAGIKSQKGNKPSRATIYNRFNELCGKGYIKHDTRRKTAVLENKGINIWNDRD